MAMARLLASLVPIARTSIVDGAPFIQFRKSAFIAGPAVVIFITKRLRGAIGMVRTVALPRTYAINGITI